MSFIKDTIVYGASSIISKGIVFLSIPILTSLLSVEEYGLISFVLSLVGIVSIFMRCGSNNAVQRYFFETENNDAQSVVLSGLVLLSI